MKEIEFYHSLCRDMFDFYRQALLNIAQIISRITVFLKQRAVFII